jgi:hypothetical protein
VLARRATLKASGIGSHVIGLIFLATEKYFAVDFDPASP